MAPGVTRARLRPLIVATLMLATLAGCSTPGRLPAVPASLAGTAQPLGEHPRFLVARDVTDFEQEALLSLQRERAWLAGQGQTGPMPPTDFLAVSGGGDNGAFGAGLLTGWTASGKRPQFKVVTG